jgi:hypothetical protein
MPVFHFNIRDANGLVRDEEGMELADGAAAHREAQASARELLADVLRANEVVDGRKIEITDAGGTVVETVPLRDMLN